MQQINNGTVRYFEDIVPVLLGTSEKLAMCLVVSTSGSTPRKTGARMIISEHGKVYGTIGGGQFEKKVTEQAIDVIRTGKPGIFRHELLQQHDMCCGGTMDVFIEPIQRKMKLYIFGSGHTGQALAKFAADLEFEVTLADDREEFIRNMEATGVKTMCMPFRDLMPTLQFDNNTAIVIMTYRHDIDRELLAFCINQPHAYLGMIGSRRKILVTKKKFKDAGTATVQSMAEVDMPVGIDIGADGPKEIAISILAKLISVRSKVKKNE